MIMKDQVVTKDKVWIILTTLAWILVLGLAGYQVLDYFKFKNAGKRFTAADGQALCLRVQALETDKKPCQYAP
jgi:hypothetical protein